jgi:hypothetical protein
MNYSDLQTNIAQYLHRTDLAAKIPSFISLAESTIFRELQVKELQISASGTTTAGYADLPSDFGTVSKVTVTYNGDTRNLDYLAEPVEASGVYQPTTYSLELDKLKINGSGTGQAYTLFYIPVILPLSDSNSTNWLLDNAYDLYFYASALETARYVRNDGEIAKLGPMVPALLTSVKDFSNRRGQPMTGSMQIRPRRG